MVSPECDTLDNTCTTTLILPLILLILVLDDCILLTPICHLACLTSNTVQIRPNELRCLAEEVADAWNVGQGIYILTEVMMATNGDRWDDRCCVQQTV
jgi:hypothetical protein